MSKKIIKDSVQNGFWADIAFAAGVISIYGIFKGLGYIANCLRF